MLDTIKNQLPVIVRYVLTFAFASLASHGLTSPEQNAILSQNMDVIVGAVGGLLMVCLAMFFRPSAKALEVAKKVDAQVPKADAVVIKTPAGVPDIVVHAK